MARYGIGQPQVRGEDIRFLSGRGRFVADLNFPQMAHVVFVRSPHAAARILVVDGSGAASLPGVVAVLTGQDAARDRIGDCRTQPVRPGWGGTGLFLPPRPVIAADRVRHVGEPVAVVVAESVEQARDAAEAVEVSYEPEPAVITSDAALATGAPVLWPEAPGNIAFTLDVGDRASTDLAFRAADCVVDLTLTNNRLSANPIEPRAAVGLYDDSDGRFTLYATTQAPHRLRQHLASDVLGIAEQRLRIVSPDVGGGFGMKAVVYPEDALVLWVARRTGRPAKWVGERNEVLVADMHARDEVWSGAAAFNATGRILGIRAAADFNLGAYPSLTGTVPPQIATTMLTGVYDIPAMHVVGRGVYTNTTWTGPYRGAGQPEATYFMERLVDRVADAMGLDRSEVRRRNMVAPTAIPYRTLTGFAYDSGDFPAVLDTALRVTDWQEFEDRRALARERGRLRGIGLSFFIEMTTLFNERMEIRFDSLGDVTVLAGTHSHGQGHETVYAQMVSEWLGIDGERVRVVQGDTDLVSFGRGTYASRSTTAGGSALKAASDRIVDKGRRIAAHMLESASDDLVFADGAYSVEGTDLRVTLPEVARFAFAPMGMPAEFDVGLEAVGSFTPTTPSFPNGCHVCEAEIDPETGAVEIIRYVAVDDVGRVINPLLLAGQIHGALVQGIGQALCEHALYDPESGQLLTGSFLDYTMPRADDVPGFEIHNHDVPTSLNPLGVKGAGEAGCVGSPPAVIGAVLDALRPLGVSDISLPATPEKVWSAIQAAAAER